MASGKARRARIAGLDGLATVIESSQEDRGDRDRPDAAEARRQGDRRRRRDRRQEQRGNGQQGRRRLRHRDRADRDQLRLRTRPAGALPPRPRRKDDAADRGREAHRGGRLLAGTRRRLSRVRQRRAAGAQLDERGPEPKRHRREISVVGGLTHLRAGQGRRRHRALSRRPRRALLARRSRLDRPQRGRELPCPINHRRHGRRAGAVVLRGPGHHRGAARAGPGRPPSGRPSRRRDRQLRRLSTIDVVRAGGGAPASGQRQARARRRAQPDTRRARGKARNATRDHGRRRAPDR